MANCYIAKNVAKMKQEMVGEIRGAMQRSWEEVVKLYLENPISHITKISRSGYTALHVAVADGNEEIVEKLVNQIVKAEQEKSTNGIQILEKNDIWLEPVEDDGFVVVEKGEKIVEMYSKPLEIKNEVGNTALHLAALIGNIPMCRAITKPYSDQAALLIEIENNMGETPLFLASLHGKKDAFLYLNSILKKTRPETAITCCRRHNGDTVLHCAIDGEFFVTTFRISYEEENDTNNPNIGGDKANSKNNPENKDLENPTDTRNQAENNGKDRNDDDDKKSSEVIKKRKSAIIIAARNGITEMVKRILKKFPMAIYDTNEDEKNVVLLALENKQFVKNSMPENFCVGHNNNGETPEAIFTRDHKKLVETGSEWMRKTAESCSLVAALIATVAFATSTSLPGGTSDQNGKPLMATEPAFHVFAVSSLIALCFSVTSLVMFLAILTSRFSEKDFDKVLPWKLLMGLTSLFLAIVSMLVSFCAGHFFVLQDALKVAAFPVYTVTFIPISFFAVAQFPLYIDLVRATFWSPFGDPRKLFAPSEY
ncbi:hypothetical protein G4B88_019275 [Cannabis sativa]|uniref:PGG domain-containing protein n=1 Tax=Cannabis sativa TaxID=3483 RepID=A0A7J6DVU2_CANSA|nr:hypothetical protein G4B88_019275 [Cannabis sativa]